MLKVEESAAKSAIHTAISPGPRLGSARVLNSSTKVPAIGVGAMQFRIFKTGCDKALVLQARR